MRFQLRVLIWFLLAFVLTPSSIQSEMIGKAQLEQIRLSVESYMSRIQSIHMDYIVDWEPDRDSPRLPQVGLRQD